MPDSTARSARISPTAFATGYFWYRHGMSHPSLATRRGSRLDRLFGLLIRGTRALSGVSLEAMMLARHRGIDGVLAHAIDQRRVSQVIEIAAGLSPRGWRFAQRFGAAIQYVETDLPAMAALKRRRLNDAELLSPHHRVVQLDALIDHGPHTLDALARRLDPKRGTAIITEGLMNYLDPGTAREVWQRIARTLKRFPQGIYLSDLYLVDENRGAAMTAFGAVLSGFVRSRMHVHFRTTDEAVAVLQDCGFRTVRVHETHALPETCDLASTPGADRVRILEARV